MRFPHRVRITDIRNRQPPEGVAYNAVNYDLLRQNLKLDTRITTDYKTSRVEPPNVTTPFYDLPALVNMTNDGDRDKTAVTYSIKVPLSSFNKAKEYLESERNRSIEKFGYSEERAESVLFFSNQGIQNISRGSLGSATIGKKLSIQYLTISEVPNHPNPFTTRAVAGVFYYRFTSGIIDGIFPPIQRLGVTGDDLITFTTADNVLLTADLGPGYEVFFQIRRADTYLDMVEFRCIESLPYL